MRCLQQPEPPDDHRNQEAEWYPDLPLTALERGHQEVPPHAEAFQERLHTVTLPEQAYAVDHTIQDLHLWDWEVSVTAVRRGGIRGESPAPETRLQAGDVLVLAGTPQHLEHAEGLLLYGH